MLVVSISFILLALVLYSVSIWSEQIRKEMKVWMVKVFATAFACDLIGTSIMFCRTTEINTHSIWGCAALLGMGLHLIWALLAFKYHGRTARYFHRCSLVAWVIWLAAFYSGIPKG